MTKLGALLCFQLLLGHFFVPAGFCTVLYNCLNLKLSVSDVPAGDLHLTPENWPHTISLYNNIFLIGEHLFCLYIAVIQAGLCEGFLVSAAETAQKACQKLHPTVQGCITHSLRICSVSSLAGTVRPVHSSVLCSKGAPFQATQLEESNV